MLNLRAIVKATIPIVENLPDNVFPFDVKIKLEETGGPSGGLIFAIGVVEKLTAEDYPNDLTFKTYSNLNIAQIADAVGFEDADYFSRRFRQIVGCSPGRFRSSKPSC